MQSFSLNPFYPYAYRPDNAKCIASIRLDNILFRDVVQSLVDRENYDTRDFLKQAENEDKHEIHNLEYKLFYHQPTPKKGMYAK